MIEIVALISTIKWLFSFKKKSTTDIVAIALDKNKYFKSSSFIDIAFWKGVPKDNEFLEKKKTDNEGRTNIYHSYFNQLSL